MVSTPDEAVELIAAVFRFVHEPPAGVAQSTEGSAEIADAVERQDNPALYRILMDGFSFQGISDANARAYIARHGNADWATVASALAGVEFPCPKLVSSDAYRGCGYRRTQQSCGNPEALSLCPAPHLPLRKGLLNQQAFSLFLFVRDRCGGDLVGFIDQTIASTADEPDPATAAREQLLAAFGAVSGVSRKLASMMLATLLMSAGSGRPDWVAVGQTMVVVDSLVHNFLHRTGILAAFGATHPYGQRCFRDQGCEAVLRQVTEQVVEARAELYPISPRSLQHAIWRFCAGSELNVCNGMRIPNKATCELAWCAVWSRCAHLPLRFPAPAEVGT